jgi:5'(3')-deoxyribonucleotidase
VIKVLLDMDGVLVNFTKGMFDAFGMKNKTAEVLEYECFGTPVFPPKFHEMNNKCTREFWANLEWWPDGEQILTLVESFFEQKDIYLLTCPMPNSESWTGKYEWVIRNLPEYSERLIITRNCKSILASRDNVLIDDKEGNIEQFVTAGGKGILVPRPWNFLRTVNTLEFIKGQLFDINPHPLGKVI